MADNDIKVHFRGDSSDLNRSLASVHRDLDQFDDHIRRVGLALKAFAVTAAVAFAAVTVAAGALAYSAIKAASDVSESLSKNEKVFGEQSAAVDEWAKSLASLGMSRREALSAVGAYGSLFKQLGKTDEEAAAMSESLVQLAIDLASINNTSTGEALAAIQSGLAGEMEPLRKYQIFLDDATLRQKAFEMGLTSSTKEALDPQSKALATNALLLEKGAYALNDFTDTQDGAAGKAKQLAAQFDNLKVELGDRLLPIAVAVMTWINNSAIPTLQDWWAWLGPKLSDVIDGARRKFEEWQPTLQALWSTLTTSVIPALQQFWSWISEKLIPTVGEASDKVIQFATNAWDKALKPVFEAIGPALLDLKDKWDELWAKIDGPVLTALKAVALVIGTALVASLLALGAILIVLTKILGIWFTAWSAIVDVIGWAIDKVRAFYDWLGKLADRMSAGSPEFAEFLKGMFGGVGGLVFRAEGGPLAAGQPAIVGEAGPELFVPGTAGTVVPNGSAMVGGATISLTVNAGMGADGRRIGDEIVTVLREWSRRNGPLTSAIA